MDQLLIGILLYSESMGMKCRRMGRMRIRQPRRRLGKSLGVVLQSEKTSIVEARLWFLCVGGHALVCNYLRASKTCAITANVFEYMHLQAWPKMAGHWVYEYEIYVYLWDPSQGFREICLAANIDVFRTEEACLDDFWQTVADEWGNISEDHPDECVVIYAEIYRRWIGFMDGMV